MTVSYFGYIGGKCQNGWQKTKKKKKLRRVAISRICAVHAETESQ